MKRNRLALLMLLGLAFAVTGLSAAEKTEAAPASVVLLDQELEVALLAQNDIVSGASTCLVCVAQAGACSGGSGRVCNRAKRCTCQPCGGNVVCRPSKIILWPRPLHAQNGM